MNYSYYDDYSSLLGSSSSSLDSFASAGIWTLIALIIAVIGGICLYFTVFSDKKAGTYTGFMAKFYDFVKFKKMFLTSFLKVMYIISALFVTLASFGVISASFLSFVGILVIGNILVRVGYEFSLVLLGIYENTTEIAKSTKKAEKSEE